MKKPGIENAECAGSTARMVAATAARTGLRATAGLARRVAVTCVVLSAALAAAEVRAQSAGAAATAAAQNSEPSARVSLPVPDRVAGGFGESSARRSPSRHSSDDAGDGRLLFRTEAAGEYIGAPRIGTWISIDVRGVLARTTVTQRFHNPTDRWLEGLYVFPLPDGAAVDTLRMKVGDRSVEGRIRRKERARAEYRRARDAGRVAVVAEQRRPDVFRSAVANIAPHADVIVEIEFQSLVRYDSGTFALRFPLVVAPRHPGIDVAAAAPDRARRSDRLTPGFEVLATLASDADVEPVELDIELDAGIAIDTPTSPSHAIIAQGIGEDRYNVTLAHGSADADREFVLEWTPRRSDAPVIGLHTEIRGDHSYQLLMLVPPAASASARRARIAREIVLVIDTSGSMAGESLREAKAAVRTALSRLSPRDRFNVIRFDSKTSAVFGRSEPATAGNVESALVWVDDLRADGGTEMGPALDLALRSEPRVAGAADRLRQVVFVTDGQVGNETELLELIGRRLGDSRLFTVGIGSAPNASFMRRAAAAGRGSFVFISGTDQVAERMGELLAKLERPVVTDIEIDHGSAGDAIVWPERVPDLYAGEPVVTVSRIPGTAPPMTVRGRTGGQPWEVRVPGDSVPAHSGSAIAKLWAARTVESLSDRLSRRDLDASERSATEQTAAELALAFGVVSPFTSLIAVDSEIARDADQPLARGSVRTATPAGWRHAAALEPRERPLLTWDTAVINELAAVSPRAAGGGDSSALQLAALPQGNTGSMTRLIVGLLMLLAAAMIATGARGVCE